MSTYNLDLEVVDAGMDDGKFRITILPKGEYSFFGLIFNFYNISLEFAEDGIGVSYDLNVDFASTQVPDVITPERQEAIRDFGHQLLNVVMENIMSAIQSGLDKSMQEQYTSTGCTNSCTGECHEGI
jgi:hypothetical protein